jgi:hypothetical protein
MGVDIRGEEFDVLAVAGTHVPWLEGDHVLVRRILHMHCTLKRNQVCRFIEKIEAERGDSNPLAYAPSQQLTVQA